MNRYDTPPGWQGEHSSFGERLTLGSGIVFGLIQLAALVFAITAIFSHKPTIDAPVIEQAAWYAQHGDTLAVGNLLLALPAPFFLLFLGGLFGNLRRAEGDSNSLSIAALGSGIALALIWPFGCMLTDLGITIARNGGDAATVWALDALAPLSLALSSLPRTVLLVVSSVLLLRARRIPRPIGWLGLLAALAGLVGSGTLVASGLFPVLSIGSLLFEIWVLALSAALLRQARPARQVAPHPVMAQ